MTCWKKQHYGDKKVSGCQGFGGRLKGDWITLKPQGFSWETVTLELAPELYVSTKSWL